MSGQFRTSPSATAPEPKPTTRLRLLEVVEGGGDGGLCGLVSAQVMVHGGMDLYHDNKARLGPDPLRDDADAELFIGKAERTSKSIGAVLMDQTFVGTCLRAPFLALPWCNGRGVSNSSTSSSSSFYFHHPYRQPASATSTARKSATRRASTRTSLQTCYPQSSYV
jgi:hypothetical protein